MSIMNVADGFEQIFEYYRLDPNIQKMIEDHSLLIAIKFTDTKSLYMVSIDHERILLETNSLSKKPDIRVRIKSEQVFLDLMNGKIPIREPFVKGKIIIVKGFGKIVKLYRKYVE
ncbi:MAG: hypothetical protein JW776_12620 [Candidatus Lokiarchaeota archaeon]|nr:hypothetical protein [Candidatus Lokiarchaeota archaeon]